MGALRMNEKDYEVFLCHNSQDKAAVKLIAHALQDAGLSVFFDEWELRPGFLWQPLVEKAISASRAIAVFVGPSGFGPVQHEEMQVALTKQRVDGAPVIPISLPGASVEALPVTSFLKQRTWSRFNSLNSASEEFRNDMDRLVWAITGKMPARVPAAASPPLAMPRKSPVDVAAQRFFNAAQARNAVLLLGRAWRRIDLARADDEPNVVCHSLADALLSLPHAQSGMLPSLEEIATCYSAFDGQDSFESRVRSVLMQSVASQLPATDVELLARFLRQMLARPPAQRAGRIADCPIIITSALGLAPEAALLRANLPFVRVVQSILTGKDRPRTQLHVGDCTDSGFRRQAQHALSGLDGPAAAALTAECLNRAPSAGHDGDSTPFVDFLPRRDEPYVVLIKGLGSIDIENSCMLTRSNIVNYAQVNGPTNPYAGFINGALSSRPTLIAGFRLLDVDFIALHNLFMRPSFASADARNSQLMIVSPPDGEAEALARRYFMANLFEEQNYPNLHSGLTASGIQVLETELSDLLRRIADLQGTAR